MYLFDEPPTSERKELQRRAKILLSQLREKRAVVIVPSLALSEFLVGYDTKKHGALIAELNSEFLFAPFDVRAAAVASEIWNLHKTLSTAQRVERKVLKADAIIVATAKTAGAETIFTNDPHIHTLAKLVRFRSRDLPDHHENMFDDAVSRGEIPPQGSPRRPN